MEYLVTAGEMKQYDANTIDVIGIPGMVLMERAALGAFSLIEEKFGTKDRSRTSVLIVAGMGNNGGDGLALARLLVEAGYPVEIDLVGDSRNASEQWKLQKKILEYYSVGTCDTTKSVEYTIIVDALLGVGLSRNIEGVYAQAVQRINQAKAFKLALDVPSGICSDTGKVLGCAVCADVTVTFGFCKRGLMFYPGNTYAGEVITVPIGISEKSFLGKEPEMFYYREAIAKLLPKREKTGNKGTFGKVLVMAGSPKMSGAAVLAAKAAYRCGAGMVKVISHPENREVIQISIPEALYGTYEDALDSMSWADVLVIGPGLGKSDEALALFKLVIQESKLPLVIDADGLNMVAQHEELQQELARQGQNGRQMILTPHVGELSRLTKVSVEVLKENLAFYGKELAKQLHSVIVAKDAQTFICREKGAVCVNLCGNSGMATAGSGDVLAGVIAGLSAQGMDAFEAASVGVYVHAKAGDKAAAEIGEYACMAGDICNKLCDTVRDV